MAKQHSLEELEAILNAIPPVMSEVHQLVAKVEVLTAQALETAEAAIEKYKEIEI